MAEKKKSNTKKNTKPVEPKKKMTVNEAIKRELICLVMIAVAMLVFFLNITNSGGEFGRLVSLGLRNTFGTAGVYILSALMAFIGVLIGRKKIMAKSKIIFVSVLYVLILSFIHITGFSGGYIGNGFGGLLLRLFGTAVSLIIVIMGIIILFVLITEKSFLGLLSKSYGTVKEKIPERKERSENDYKEAKKSEIKPKKVSALRKRSEIYDIGEKTEKSKVKILLSDEVSEAEESNIILVPPVTTPTVTHISAVPRAKAKVVEEEASEITFKGVDIVDTEDEVIQQVVKPVEVEKLDFHENVDGGIDTEYVFPPIDLLNENPDKSGGISKTQILENSRKLEETLKSFGVSAKVVEVSKGPTVTRYELSPGMGVKVSKISGLADDLALNLRANGIRIEAPILGKAAVGIEIPNEVAQMVCLREVLGDSKFKEFPSKLSFGLGKDITGEIIVTDIAKMPHLLVAGATGSGKSVCVNTLITSIIYKATPDEVKLIMIDPKVVELSVYNGIPHLMMPVVTDPKKATGALKAAVVEMEKRYVLFAENSVRDLAGYNRVLVERGEKKLPQVVIIIDELADLMMVAKNEVEESICRLAQMARAAGLHLIIATQRPSVDVITGLIKANVPSRLAFSVSSGTDSRTILNSVGAEKLLGKGDMLFQPIGSNKAMRIQGAFISDKEVESIVHFIKQTSETQYDQEFEKQTNLEANSISNGKGMERSDDEDEFFEQAVEFILQQGKASSSMLQRKFRLGYNRAARLVDYLEDRGIVGPENGARGRELLIDSYQWEQMKGNF